MTFSITPACVACDACFCECPTEAVVRAAPIYQIAANFCTECELCTDVCPVAAIVST